MPSGIYAPDGLTCMKVLLTGKNGQLGRCIQDLLSCYQDITLVAFDSSELDITDVSAVTIAFTREKPEVIVNAAAYTAVDQAETEVERAFLVNCTGVANLAYAAYEHDIPIIHISTDYVFDGEAVEPYFAESLVQPIGIYGHSKLAGERILSQITPQHIIVRTAWVFSEYGHNFVKAILRLAQTRTQLCVVSDQYGSPTDARDLARAILQLCLVIAAGRQPWGTYHFAGDQPTSRYGLARTILKKAVQQGLLEQLPELCAISTVQYPTLAKRPSYSVLKDHNLQRLYGISASDWSAGLDRVLTQLKHQQNLEKH